MTTTPDTLIGAAPPSSEDAARKLAREQKAAEDAAAGRAALALLEQAVGTMNPANVNALTIAAPSSMGLAPRNALVRLDHFSYEPRDWKEAYGIAKFACASRLVPYDNPATALIVMMTGRELGLTTAQSLRSIYVVDGKPALSSHLHGALALRSGLCEYLVCVETTVQYAIFETKRKGAPTPQRHGWSLQDAERAELLRKTNWLRYPAAMLRSRAGTELVRMVYPDVVLGLYDPDELGANVLVYEPGPRDLPVLDAVVSGPVIDVKTASETTAKLDELFGKK